MFSIITQLGGRRYIMIMGGCFVFTLLLLRGTINETSYITLILSFTGGYLVANGHQKSKEIGND